MNVAIEMPRPFADRPAPEKPGSARRSEESPFEERLREARERDDARRREARDSAERPPDGREAAASAEQAGENRSPSTARELDAGFAQEIEAEAAADIASSAEANQTAAQAPAPTGQAAVPPPGQPTQTGAPSQTAGEPEGFKEALRTAAMQPKAQPEGVGIQVPKAAAPTEDAMTGKGQSADAPFDMQRLLGHDLSRTTSSDPLSKASAAPPPRPMPAVIPLDHVAVHIAKSAASGNDRIQIQLTPASLGTIDVDLELTEDGRVDAVVRVEKPETLELLQRDARQLVRALQDAGLQADSGSLTFELRDQGGRQEQPAAWGGSPSRDEARDTGAETIAQQPIRRQLAGGVDIIA